MEVKGESDEIKDRPSPGCKMCVCGFFLKKLFLTTVFLAQNKEWKRDSKGIFSVAS